MRPRPKLWRGSPDLPERTGNVPTSSSRAPRAEGVDDVLFGKPLLALGWGGLLGYWAKPLRQTPNLRVVGEDLAAVDRGRRPPADPHNKPIARGVLLYNPHVGPCVFVIKSELSCIKAFHPKAALFRSTSPACCVEVRRGTCDVRPETCRAGSPLVRRAVAVVLWPYLRNND